MLLRYDGGDWEQAAEFRADTRRTALLPLLPRRAESFRLRLEGEGACRIHSLTREMLPGRER